jgi:hypothetical protein
MPQAAACWTGRRRETLGERNVDRARVLEIAVDADLRRVVGHKAAEKPDRNSNDHY